MSAGDRVDRGFGTQDEALSDPRKQLRLEVSRASVLAFVFMAQGMPPKVYPQPRKS